MSDSTAAAAAAALPMEWLWSEAVWCPPGLKWSDFKPDSAQIKDLYYALPTAVALIILRYISETLLFRPLGSYMCRGSSSSGQSSNGSNGGIKSSKLDGDKTSKTKVARRAEAKLKTVYKFSESMWRFTFYFTASVYGWCFVLKGKPYLTDTMHTLYDYPHHPVKSEEWWYYNVELAFYLSLIFTQFVDTKRKDFWQMFVHHVVTVALLVLSWACNFHRIGALVLAIHDVADVPMEATKLAKYIKYQRVADTLFIIFAVIWIYTRCYVLPTRVIYYTSYKALSIIPFFPAYYIFNGLLCLLQLLHFAWTWIIMRIAYYAIQDNGMKDLRSDSDEDSEELHQD